MAATTICFANIKGGVGKTTLATNVAQVLAAKLDLKILLVDMDPQLNATTAVFDYEEAQEHRRTHRSIYNFFDTSPEFDEPLRASQPVNPCDVKPVPTRWRGLDLILGSLDVAFLEMRSMPGQTLRAAGLDQGLRAIGAKDWYDLIIIDTPPTPSDYLVASLRAADFFVAPCKSDHFSGQGLGLFLRVYETLRMNSHLKIRAEPLGVVLTLAQNDAQEAEGRKIVGEIGAGAKPRFLGRETTGRFFDLFEGCLRSCAAISKGQARQRLILDLPRWGSSLRAQQSILKIAQETYRKVQQAKNGGHER